ncbi:unnamed protein product [Choristocarpus tenellus]
MMVVRVAAGSTYSLALGVGIALILADNVISFRSAAGVSPTMHHGRLRAYLSPPCVAMGKAHRRRRDPRLTSFFAGPLSIAPRWKETSSAAICEDENVHSHPESNVVCKSIDTSDREYTKKTTLRRRRGRKHARLKMLALNGMQTKTSEDHRVRKFLQDGQGDEPMLEEEWAQSDGASSTKAQIYNAKDERFMKLALRHARRAYNEGEVPVGAVLVEESDTGGPHVIASGRNAVERKADASAHAEMLCLQEGSKLRGNWRMTGSTLYITVEPCVMCLSAIQVCDQIVKGTLLGTVLLR